MERAKPKNETEKKRKTKTKAEKEVLRRLIEQLELHHLPKQFYEDVLGLLRMFQYEISEKDAFALCMSILKIKQEVLNYCNITAIPKESLVKFSEMVCGDFLYTKLNSGTLSIDAVSSAGAITALSEGDIKVEFGETISASEQLSGLLQKMISMEGGDFSCYRRLVW